MRRVSSNELYTWWLCTVTLHHLQNPTWTDDFLQSFLVTRGLVLVREPLLYSHASRFFKNSTWLHFSWRSLRGGSRNFFRRGCTRLLLYFNTNKQHSFFCRIPVVLENRRSSRGGGGAHPLHPPPRSASGSRPVSRQTRKVLDRSDESFLQCGLQFIESNFSWNSTEHAH